MNRFTFFSSMAVRVVVIAALAVSYGCSSSPNAKPTVDSMGVFGNETAKGKDSIDNTMKALETLVASPAAEIRANTDAYSKSVMALDDQAKVVRAEAAKMKANGDAYFKAWEGTDTVTPERRAELTASYAKIKENLASANDGFTPFLASLKDIQSYVSLDPTLKGISSMGDLVKKAKANSADVKSRLDAVLTSVNSVRGMLSTK